MGRRDGRRANTNKRAPWSIHNLAHYFVLFIQRAKDTGYYI